MDSTAILAECSGVYHRVHTFISINGTGSPDPFGGGFSGAIGAALDPRKFYWQPTGYPAAVFPMGPSVDAGVQAVIDNINAHPGTFFLSGYSQGAIVVDKVWRDHILNGELNHRLNDMVGIVNFGDPLRCPGIANGNAFAGDPLPKNLDGVVTGGIAGPDCLTPAQTPEILLSFAHDGDLYASAPIGTDPWHSEAPAGQIETLIYNVVQNATGGNVLAIAEEVLKVVTNPLSEIVPLVEAILNGGMFAVNGAAAHTSYTIDAALQWVNERGASVDATGLPVY